MNVRVYRATVFALRILDAHYSSRYIYTIHGDKNRYRGISTTITFALACILGILLRGHLLALSPRCAGTRLVSGRRCVGIRLVFRPHGVGHRLGSGRHRGGGTVFVVYISCGMNLG